jgi:dihydropteroate synthase
MKSDRPHADEAIPTLTEIVELEGPSIDPQLLEAMQAEISARVMRLVEELMREASRELETILLKRVSDRLRQRLPELVEDAMREHLGPGD